MSIDRSDFDAIDESDLQELVDGQVPENHRLDYKRTLYGRAADDKLEMLKDVSALANTQGGHLVLGVEEKKGVATRLVGLGDLDDADAEIRRMEQTFGSGLEPKVSGIRTRAIQLSDGRLVLVVRVPRSWHPPHRVKANNANRFYVRRSAHVEEPSVEELRAMFMQSASALQQAQEFRNQRIPVATAAVGKGGTTGLAVLHIVSTAAFSGRVHLDVEIIKSQHESFRPIGTSGWDPTFNFLGFMNRAPDAGYTQVFRNGCVEAVRMGIVTIGANENSIQGQQIEQLLLDAFCSYIDGLRNLEIPPPLIAMFTLHNIGRPVYRIANDPWLNQESLPDNTMTLPECIVDDYGTQLDYHRAVRPAFDALWNAVGHSRAMSFDKEGRWNGGWNDR